MASPPPKPTSGPNTPRKPVLKTGGNVAVAAGRAAKAGTERAGRNAAAAADDAAAAPEKAPREQIFIIFGPPGAGKGSQAANVVKALGIPHLTVSDVSSLGGRIGQKDCAKGFILDGFPRTVEQAKDLDELLATTKEKVVTVFNLEVPDEVLGERIGGRWVHELSGRSYHVTFAPPKSLPAGAKPSADNMLDDKTGDPLEQNPDDTADGLKVRLAAYHEETEPVLEHYKQYSGTVCKVDANQAPNAVWKKIAKILGVEVPEEKAPSPAKSPAKSPSKKSVQPPLKPFSERLKYPDAKAEGVTPQPDAPFKWYKAAHASYEAACKRIAAEQGA